jgi:hypothetical protein
MKRCTAVILCFAFPSVGHAFSQQPGDPATKEDIQQSTI